MGEEYYAVIKLVSGEEIFSLVIVEEDQDDPVLLLHHPIKMHIIQTPKGGFIKVNPWMELSDEDLYMINLNQIITMTETNNPRLIEVYNKFTSGEEEPEAERLFRETGQVRPDSKMGYVSSVQEARIKLEDIFKNIKES